MQQYKAAIKRGLQEGVHEWEKGGNGEIQGRRIGGKSWLNLGSTLQAAKERHDG